MIALERHTNGDMILNNTCMRHPTLWNCIANEMSSNINQTRLTERVPSNVVIRSWNMGMF
jgi:hypothetical protein